MNNSVLALRDCNNPACSWDSNALFPVYGQARRPLTHPRFIPQLHRLVFSLRHSKEERIDLDTEEEEEAKKREAARQQRLEQAKMAAANNSKLGHMMEVEGEAVAWSKRQRGMQTVTPLIPLLNILCTDLKSSWHSIQSVAHLYFHLYDL